jgi:hypothetical protein
MRIPIRLGFVSPSHFAANCGFGVPVGRACTAANLHTENWEGEVRNSKV